MENTPEAPPEEQFEALEEVEAPEVTPMLATDMTDIDEREDAPAKPRPEEVLVPPDDVPPPEQILTPPEEALPTPEEVLTPPQEEAGEPASDGPKEDAPLAPKGRKKQGKSPEKEPEPTEKASDEEAAAEESVLVPKGKKRGEKAQKTAPEKPRESVPEEGADGGEKTLAPKVRKR